MIKELMELQKQLAKAHAHTSCTTRAYTHIKAAQIELDKVIKEVAENKIEIVVDAKIRSM